MYSIQILLYLFKAVSIFCQHQFVFINLSVVFNFIIISIVGLTQDD